MGGESLTLYQLNQQIRDVLFEAFPVSYWVVAEISDIRINRSGHCYLELIEKDAASDEIIAKSRANIWSSTCRILLPYFEMTTGKKLSAGLKVLVNLTVEFHELFGSSLNIKDIDPAYTIGDLAQKRKEIIARLEEDGIINMNKELQLTDVPQHIAIISSDTAAGYEDFTNQLLNNKSGIQFYVKLFPAIMQGVNAEKSIMQAFDRVFENESFFDVIVLIRGGGSKSDLSCFDTYELSYYITQFPVPVITGIGHERDDSIVDLVAHTNLKTPTAVAEFLLSRAIDFENHLYNLELDFNSIVKETLSTEKSKLEQYAIQFAPFVNNVLNKEKLKLQMFAGEFKNFASNFISQQRLELHDISGKYKYYISQQFALRQQDIVLYKKQISNIRNQFLQNKYHELEILDKTNSLLDPDRILKRGYSIVLKDGKIVKSIKLLKPDDKFIAKLSDGQVEGKVLKTFKGNSKN